MAKRLLRDQAGFAISWAVIILVIVCLLSVFVLSVGLIFSSRSTGEYSRFQAYLTARSAAGAIAEKIESLYAVTAAEDQEPVYDSNLIPQVGQSLEATGFSFDYSGMGDIDGAVIRRADEDTITVTVTASVGDKSSTVSVSLKQNTAPSGEADEMSFLGLYAKSLEIANNTKLTAAAGSDVYVPGSLKTYSHSSASIGGDMYFSGSVPSSITVGGDIIGDCPQIEMSGKFIDTSEDFISLSDGNAPGDVTINLDALSDQYGSRYYILDNGDVRDIGEISVVGNMDSNRTIGKRVTLTAGESANYYIFVPRGATLNFKMVSTDASASPQVYIILDGTNAFSDVTGAGGQSYFGVDNSSAAFYYYSADSGINLYLYGAGGSYAEIRQNASFAGGIHCDTLKIKNNLDFTYASPSASAGGQGYKHTWKTGLYSVD